MSIETIAQLEARFADNAWPNGTDFAALIGYAKGNKSAAGDPTVRDILEGQSQLWHNSVNGEVREWTNVGGLLYKSRAYTAVPGFALSSLFTGGIGGGAWNLADRSHLWKDSGGTSAITDQDDEIYRIDDLSGNGLHLLQATSTKRPKWQVDGDYGYSKFDGVDDYVDVLITPKPAAYTVMSAFRLRSLTGSQAICGAGASDGNSFFQWGTMLSRSGSAKLEWSFGSGSAGRYGTTVEDVFVANEIMTVTHMYTSGATPAVYDKNGVATTHTGQVGAATTCAGDPYNFAVGRFGMFNNFYAGVDMFGQVAISRALTLDERNNVRAYFADWIPE